jgi:hypothetical protein
MNLPQMVCKKVSVIFREIKEFYLELTSIKNFQSLSDIIIHNQSNLFNQFNLQDVLNNVSKITFDSISSNCYFNLYNLEELTITDTNMLEVKREMFESLVNLKVLDLSNNLISFIESNSFDNLLNLEKLNLNSNSIIIIQTNLLKRLKKLREFYKEDDDDDNEMIIEFNAFDFLENLEVLKIRNYRLPISDDIKQKMSSFLSQSSKFLLCLEQKPNTSLFKNLTKLKNLKIWIQNELESNELGTLTNLEELSLRFKSEISIETHMFDLMKSLRVLKIKIIENMEKINERIFIRLLNIEEINLDMTVSKPFSVTLLSHLNRLKRMTLRGLNLSESNVLMFKDFKKIFDLTNNAFELKVLRNSKTFTLENIRQSNSFENLEFLNELRIEDDPTLNENLNINNICSLKNLKILNLDNCNLRDDSFENNLFKISNCLEELYLNENLLTTVNSEWFVSLENLRILSLEMNQIRTINQYSFKSLKKLEELNLSNNQIDIIQPNLFISQNLLKNLLLNENELIILDEYSLNGLCNLEEFDLRANKITLIKESEIRFLQNLNVLLINRQRSRLNLDFACLKCLKKLRHLFIDSKIELKEYIYFEYLKINLYKQFFKKVCFKKILNENFLLEKAFDELF